MLLHFLALSHKTHPPFLCPYPPLHLFIWPCTELCSSNFFFPFACAWHASQDFLCQPPLWCCCDFKFGTFVVTTMLLIFKQQSPALTRAWVVVTHGQLAFLPVMLASTPTQCIWSCKTYCLSSQIFSVHGASLSPWPYHPSVTRVEAQGQPVISRHCLCLRGILWMHQVRVCSLDPKDWGTGLPVFSVSSFPFSLQTAIGLLHLSMKASGTLLPAEGDYTSWLALQALRDPVLRPILASSLTSPLPDSDPAGWSHIWQILMPPSSHS